MKKSKKSREEPRDRLSELPDSLIYEIFGLLPMRDVVRTTLLSKRWENLWTTTSYLNFDFNGQCKSKFFHRALILWRGSKILKFKCYYGSYRDKSVFTDIDVWLRLAKEKGIQELYLELSAGNDEGYVVPHNLYSCSSLKVLSLKGCNFQTHGNVNVQWNQLKRLTIGGLLIDRNLIEKVISGSPQLEVFHLTLRDRDEDLSIQSTSLKDLWIDRYVEGEPSTVSELRIWSPNLETLHLGGVPYAKYSLMNVSSLTHLKLELYCNGELGDDYFDQILGQIFSTVQHVEKLLLSNRCIQVIDAMEKKKKTDLLTTFSDIKFLTITGSDVYYEDIVNLLLISPKLETLVIDSINCPMDYELEIENHEMSCFLQGERNIPKSFLLQMRTVEITCMLDDHLIFTFTEILLKHASKLQKMVIRLSKNHTSPKCLCLALQKLIRLPRSSPTAELIVAEAEY